MYLKRIELQGFKSFAGKTVLEFHKGITSVVGPNGSGKSNIADAVRWVLGEQSAKQLRGSRMFDVIFSGTEYRKSVGFAEVTLVIDNSEGKLPIDYSEVAVRRRLYRSGESDYSINGNSCRLRDIRDLFLDTGVGRDGYSIISQGKIQEILSVKSEDRRGIFEEAAGIMKYKVRKLEAERKLERTEQNLLRIGDIVRELGLQLEPLEKQAEKAKEFLKLRDRLQKYEVGLYLNNYKNNKARIEKYEEDLSAYGRDVEELEARLEEENKKNEQRSRRMRELDSAEEEARRELNDFLMALETTRHEIQISKERLNSIKNGRERARREIEGIEEKKEQLAGDFLKRGERIEYLENQKKEYEVRLDDKKAELDGILSDLGEKEREISKLREAIDKKADVISELKIGIRSLELERNSLDESLTEAGRNLESLLLEKDASLLKMQDAKTMVDKITSSVRDMNGRLEKMEASIREKTDKLGKLTEERHGKNTKAGILRHNLEMLEDMEKRMEGYDAAVRELFEEASSPEPRIKGILGITAREMEVDPGYEKAIEAAAGGFLQSVIIDNADNLQNAVEYLKDEQKGRASFLAGSLDITGKTDRGARLKAESCRGFAGFASEKVRFEGRKAEFVKNLLAETAIADTYANAAAMAEATGHSINTVSLEGDFFGANGIVEGGSGGIEKSGILNREKRIKDLRRDITALEDEIGGLEKEIDKTNSSLEEIKAETETLKREVSENNGELIRKKAEADSAKEMLDRITRRIEAIEKTIGEQKEKKQENAEKMQKLREELALEENGISGLRTKIAGFETSHREQRRIRDEIHADISDLRVSLNSVKESLENAGEAINRLEIEKRELETKKEMTLLEIDEFNENERRITGLIGEKEKTLENPEEEKDRLSTKLQKVIDERKSIEAESESHIEAVNKINRDILMLQNKCSKVEVSKATAASEIESMKERMWEEYGLTHNEALSRNDEIESIGEARKEISECRKRIKELGNVNVNAIEDYASTLERYEFMSSQKEDLEASKKDLYKIIREMNSTMKKIFTERLTIINERFEKVFKELFEGGKAGIVLVDEDDILESGIDIIVQPPGKKLQNMMLLSGGEKAFTAIALLFAILDINPSPFCIFDEIEAALDETNVWKFGEYIRHYNKETQFIMITHRKGTMEHSDAIYGVTMQEHGISKVVSMNMTD